VKVREAGFYSAPQLEETDCTLTPWRSSLIHIQRRHHTKRRESPLLTKEGTFIEGILLAIRNLLQLLGSFTWRKGGAWDRLFNFPSEGRHAEDFVHRKKSNGFGRVWTRELGNQRPACESLDHRSRLKAAYSCTLSETCRCVEVREIKVVSYSSNFVLWGNRSKTREGLQIRSEAVMVSVLPLVCVRIWEQTRCN
jgi:hypothetical protein